MKGDLVFPWHLATHYKRIGYFTGYIRDSRYNDSTVKVLFGI